MGEKDGGEEQEQVSRFFNNNACMYTYTGFTKEKDVFTMPGFDRNMNGDILRQPRNFFKSLTLRQNF